MSNRQFFKALYGDLANEERIEIRAFNPTARWWCSTFEEIEAVAAQRVENVYFGVNPRRGEGSTNERVSRIVAVIADIDEKHCPDPLAALCGYGITPSAVVNSGGGIHVYWFLQDPQPDTKDFAAARKDFLKLGPSDAVHDAARILRIPGTQNTKPEYGEPRQVVLREFHPELRYPVGLFAKLCKLDKDLRRRMYDSDLTGFPSRSERDWAIMINMLACGWTDDEVCFILPLINCGDRYRERTGLLERELKSAHKNFETIIKKQREEDFIVRDNTLWRVKGAEERKVATFIFEPEALLEGDVDTEDTLMGSMRAEGTNHIWTHFQLPRKAFTDRHAMCKFLPYAATSWLGTDSDVIHYLPWLVKTLQDKGVPRLHTVKSLGRHGTVWITPTGVITQTGEKTFANAGFAYLDRNQEKPDVVYTLKSAEECAPVLKRFYELLPLINVPSVVWLIFSWFMASYHKPLLGPEGREFPILQVVGTQGAGKTSTLKDVFLPIVGYPTSKGYSCDTTDFVMMTLMSSSTSIPIFFAEYRSTILNIERFTRRLRLSYDSGFDARGRSDQTTVNYSLSAPIVVDGENPVDEPAMRERSVIVGLYKDNLNEERRKAFRELTALPLHDVAGFLVQWSLQYTSKRDLVQEIAKSGWVGSLPDRVRNNIYKIAYGFQMIHTLAYELNIPRPEIDFADVIRGWLESIILADTGGVAILVDEFVEDLINTVVREKLTMGVAAREKGVRTGFDPFLWTADERAGTLSFHLSTALNWWVQYRKRAGLATFTQATAKAQLRERLSETPAIGHYITHYGQSWGPGGAMNMYTVDLATARASGLDVPASVMTKVMEVGEIE